MVRYNDLIRTDPEFKKKLEDMQNAFEREQKIRPTLPQVQKRFLHEYNEMRLKLSQLEGKDKK